MHNSMNSGPNSKSFKVVMYQDHNFWLADFRPFRSKFLPEISDTTKILVFWPVFEMPPLRFWPIFVLAGKNYMACVRWMHMSSNQVSDFSYDFLTLINLTKNSHRWRQKMEFFVKKVPKILRYQKFLTEISAGMAKNWPIKNYDPNRSPLQRILNLDQNSLSYAFLKYCHTQNSKKIKLVLLL